MLFQTKARVRAGEAGDWKGEWKIALVGRRLTDNENLGLGYLAAALREAGFPCEQFVLNQAGDVGRIAEAIFRREYELVGLSIPDGGSAYLPLAFGEFLRRQGWNKPITCGGSFATLARHWLLDRYLWLHSVVRFAGEVPLVHLAQALREGRDVRRIPGLTTRAGDGPPAPVIDEKPMGLWPLRGDLPEVLGHPAAHILATRGCAGRCGYCAPASLQIQEAKEGQRAGVRPEVLRQSGVGGVRRRPVEALCDEMAFLWRERGVRYFYFVDEHLLPYAEADALDFLDRLGRGLRRRRVGHLGIGTMLRADRLTRKIVTAFAEVGLARAFVGIEFASSAEARRFGRSCDPEHARQILAACEAAGIAVVSHMMMVHPYSTKETIADAIQFLETVPAGVFEATQMRVYHGTTLWHRMAKAGRLVGNPLRYAYTFLDPVVERFDEIFMRLRGESFWNHSIAYRTHDAFLAHALGRRLRPELGLGPISAEMNAIRNQVVALYASTYRKALALAEAGVDGAHATALIVEARTESCRLQEQLDECVRDLAHRLDTSPRIFSPTRAAAAGAIAFAVLGGVVPGCDGKTGLKHASAPDALGNLADASQVLPVDAAPTPEAGSDSACTAAMEAEQVQRYQEAAAQAASCFNGTIGYFSTPFPSADMSISGPNSDWPNRGCCPPSDGGPTFCDNAALWENQVRSAVAGLDHSCMGYWTEVVGDTQRQADQIWAALTKCGGPGFDSMGFDIIVDGNGRVVDATGLSPEVASCLLAALSGLVFPCLAGATLCEYLLIE